LTTIILGPSLTGLRGTQVTGSISYTLVTSFHTTKGILDYVHVVLWGLSHKKSIGGASYMLTIIDDYSKEVWHYFLTH
jgi:hypothetical protein